MDKPRKTHKVNILDFAILIWHVYKAETDPRTSGCNEDSDFAFMLKWADKGTRVNYKALEICLWACNMLDECGEFWHPKGTSFTDFHKKLLGKYHKFDTTYNLIERQKHGPKSPHGE